MFKAVGKDIEVFSFLLGVEITSSTILSTSTFLTSLISSSERINPSLTDIILEAYS